MRRPIFAIVFSLVASDLWAQQPVKVLRAAWEALSPTEQSQIQEKFVVQTVENDAVGIVIDGQGVDESTPGTNAGARLGSAVANASYVDNAIRNRTYSAKGQLAANIVGAMLGSALDRGPNARFHFRYAVKFVNGDIKYFDEVKAEAFRHPVGVCVSVPILALVDQSICSQTDATLRSKYLAQKVDQATAPAANAKPEVRVESPAQTQDEEIVNCKVGTLAPVRTTAEKCKLINGRIQ